MYERQARSDFSRARRKAFWQRVHSWFSGRPDALLPYDQVREALPVQGQRYRGLQTIPIEAIVGSMGRYHEFNRAFLPKQRHTENRWVNIGKAHYQDISLPPIEVYKLGGIYFVKDGNHRVSVAKQRGMLYIDAYVIEVDIPVSLTPDTDAAELSAKRETARFLEKTRLRKLIPDAEIEISLPGEVDRLLEHIDTHRYYLGIETGRAPSYEEAVRSWYEQVYAPLVAEIEKQDIGRHFKELGLTDLYLLVSEYQWLLRQAYADDSSLEEANQIFTDTLARIAPMAAQPARKITQTLRNAPWLDNLILIKERDEFIQRTALDLRTTIPGAYSQLAQHIEDHRWYMGIDRDRPITYGEAVQDWQQEIYRPLAVLIEEMDILRYFPGRTETDLFLWIIEHQRELSESLDWEISSTLAAQTLIERAGSTSDPLPRTDDVSAPHRLESELLFKNLLVPVGDRPEDMAALDQALVIAERNGGRIHGLHVISEQDENDESAHQAIASDFERRCREAGIPGSIAMASGAIARVIAERAAWMDLIVLNLSYPPATAGISKLASGIRHVLRRSGRPVLVVPNIVTPLRRILLTYDGSPLADKALFISAVLMSFWVETELTVLVANGKRASGERTLAHARDFLDAHGVPADYLYSPLPAPDAVIEIASGAQTELILSGGYGTAPILDIAIGTALDALLQRTQIPVLIRT